jgi:peptidoglycan/LPS O-acetylase OafA/YrhL
MSRARVPELDLLRFAAAAAVVIFHFYVLLPGDTSLQRATASASRFGFLGVPLFFMISGFVILWTASNRTAGQFVLARLCRLYPSYWICVLITSAVLSVGGGGPSWRQIVANLTMLHHLFGYDSVDEVYWTLFIELKFYALISILLLCRQLQRIERWLLVWLGLSAVSLVLGLHYHSAIRGLDTLVFEGDAAYFALGCYTYLLRTEGANPRRWRGFAVSAFLSVCAALKTQDHYTLSDTWETLTTVSVIVIALCLTMSAVATRRWKLRDARAWYWLGSLTYPLYLLHAMAGKALFGMLPPQWNVWLRMGLALAAVLAPVTLLAVCIEQHGCQALYRWLSGADPDRDRPPAERPTTSAV